MVTLAAILLLPGSFVFVFQPVYFLYDQVLSVLLMSATTAAIVGMGQLTIDTKTDTKVAYHARSADCKVRSFIPAVNNSSSGPLKC